MKFEVVKSTMRKKMSRVKEPRQEEREELDDGKNKKLKPSLQWFVL